MWDDLAGVPAKLVNCLHVHDVNFCQQVCRDWRKAIKTELETVAVAYAQPVALSSFANLKHLSTFMCPYGLVPKCLTTLTALHSLQVPSLSGPMSFPWTTMSRLTSLKLENSLMDEDSEHITLPESLHTLHITGPGKICLQALPKLADLVITQGHPDSQTLLSLNGLTQLSLKARDLSRPEKAAVFSALAMLHSLVHLQVDASPSSRQIKGLTSLSKVTSLELLNLAAWDETPCTVDALHYLLSMVNLQQLTCFFGANGRSYVAETMGQPTGHRSFGAGNLSDDTFESNTGPVVAFYLMSPVSTLKLAVRDETASDAESLDIQDSDSD